MGIIEEAVSNLKNTDGHIRNKAQITLVNLMDSSDSNLSNYAFMTAVEELSSIYTNLQTLTCEMSAAYVIYKIANHKNCDSSVQNTIRNMAATHISEASNTVVQYYLFFALNTIGAKKDINAQVLIGMINRCHTSYVGQLALHMLADRLEGPYSQEHLGITYDCLRRLIMDIEEMNLFTIAHALSNLIIEPNMANTFLMDTEFVNTLIEVVRNSNNKEALWVLIQAISNADITKLLNPFIVHLYTTIKEIMPLYPTHEETDAIKYVLDVLSIHIKGEIHKPPYAFELILRKKAHPCTSQLVYDLIMSAATDGFAPLPTDALLSVKDLAALEERGFSISRGYIVTNPNAGMALNCVCDA